MGIRSASLCPVALFLALSTPPPALVRHLEGAERPNLLFILADDLGWRDTGAYGSRFHETPNIDRLARRGMLFRNAYAANPLCSPTRASILTGLYPGRIGITTPACHLPQEVLEASLPQRGPPRHKAVTPNTATRLRTTYRTLAEALREAGYRTGHFGKWHLGREPYDALQQGFDVDVPHTPGPGPAGGYIAPWKFPPQLGFVGKPGEHIEDRMAEEAVRFLRESREPERRDRPFYLNYWSFSVHSPWEAKPELIETYRPKAEPTSPQRNPLYAAMVKSLDQAVGRLLDTLDELGLAERTIVFFTSDNGGVSWQDVGGAPVTSNAPLRNGKASIYEGGTREPLLVVWPEEVTPGSTSDELVMSIDFYPTILEMLGLLPAEGQTFDGVSIVGALRGGRLQRKELFCYFPHYVPASQNLPGTWVRRGDWKLIRFFADGQGGKDRFELYNLAEDVGESTDLSAAMPERVKELDLLISRHLSEIGALVPRPNPAYRAGGERVAAAGWTASADAALSFADGCLVVDSTGRDPWLFTRDVPAGRGPFTVELEMRSASSGKGQVFWSADAGARFHRDRSVLFDPTHDGEWHAYAVKLPPEGAIEALRLDPGAAPGAIAIRKLRLLDGAGQVLKDWDLSGG